MPSEWKEVLTKIIENRLTNGIEEPLNLEWLLYLFCVDREVEFERKDVENYEIIDKVPDFSDTNKTKELMQAILTSDRLMQQFIQDASYSLPDSHDEDIDYSSVSELIVILGGDKPVLDLACGQGVHTGKLSEKGANVIGVERQYHSKYYKKYWNLPGSKFVRADIRNLPFAWGQYRVALMTNAEIYMTKEGFQETLDSVRKVLVVGGVFVIGPQSTKDGSHFIVLEKGNDDKFKKYTLKKFLSLKKSRS